VIYKVLLLQDGRFITCSNDKTIRLWNFNKTIPETVLTDHAGCVSNVIMLRSGKLCSASFDGTIKIWDIEKAKCEKTFSGNPRSYHALVELPNDILICGGENHIRFWNMQSTNPDQECTRILHNNGCCTSIVLLSDNEMTCVCGKNINIFMIYGYDYPLKKLVGHIDEIWNLLLLSDREYLLSSSKDKTMRMWNIQRASCVRIFMGDSVVYQMVLFHERIVAAAYDSGDIKLCNIYSGQCVRTLKGKGSAVGFVIGTDGELISYGAGADILIWG